LSGRWSTAAPRIRVGRMRHVVVPQPRRTGPSPPSEAGVFIPEEFENQSCRWNPKPLESHPVIAASPRSLSPALDLCRGLLAYTEPGNAISVPHAALAELVELATGSSVGSPTAPEPALALPRLHDVAALSRRYNRARATVRQWFHDGLFGPPDDRLFRGRGYVASDDAVIAFEHSTGLQPIAGEPILIVVPNPNSASDTSAGSKSGGYADKLAAGLQRVPGEVSLSGVSARGISSATPAFASAAAAAAAAVAFTDPVRTRRQRPRTPQRTGGVGSKIAAAAGSALRPASKTRMGRRGDATS
jgi:hypothetical protein